MYARIKYVCSLTHRNFFRVRSRTRANALYRLLTQTVRSLRYKLTTPALSRSTVCLRRRVVR